MPLSFRDLSIQPEYTVNRTRDIIAEFYAPALSRAIQYDRTTFTFNLGALAQAAAGVAALVQNGGRMRLICDMLAPQDIIQAALDGDASPLLAAYPPETLDDLSANSPLFADHAALAAYLVSRGRLQIRLALMPEDNGVFHLKTGVFIDGNGDKIAIVGSVNETLAGWNKNYESLTVFKSWESKDDRERIDNREEHFHALWHNRAAGVTVIDIPPAYTEYIKRIAPTDPQVRQILKRLLQPKESATPKPKMISPNAERDAYWRDIHRDLRENPANTLATIGSSLWPHQINFFNKYVDGKRDRILIADEVGLGKTIQAGILLKTRINQGRVKRALILAPKSARRQWQKELSRKFNIRIPMLELDRGRHYLDWPDSGRALPLENPLGSLIQEPMAIASYQYIRHHAKRFIDAAPRYDYVIVDEAHNARFTEVQHPSRRRPNGFLHLLREISQMTENLLLLTATPMQLHEAELWELFTLLAPNANHKLFQRFYAAKAPESYDEWKSVRDAYTQMTQRPRRLQTHLERLIWDDNPTSRKHNLTPQYMADTFAHMRQNAPTRRLMSRHTRDLLKRYNEQGLLKSRVPNRQAKAVAIPMSAPERKIYESIPTLVAACYTRPDVANALGFICTVYRKRISSSAHAFMKTLQALLERKREERLAPELQEVANEDPDELTEEETAAALADGLTFAGETQLRQTLTQAQAAFAAESKPAELVRQLRALNRRGHEKIIVFTQYKDTLDHLIKTLSQSAIRAWPVEVIHGADAADSNESRETRILRFAATHGPGILLCTDAAAESLNLQFCSAVVNYDVPWNPMKLEQRIGRIDRIGQVRPVVDVINLFYEDTAERDAYNVMRDRLSDIAKNVGTYRPILSDAINKAIAKEARGEITRDQLESEILANSPEPSVDIDEFNSDVADNISAAPNITPDRLSLPLFHPHLLPAFSVSADSDHHYRIESDSGEKWIVAYERDRYENGEPSVTWWGPGHPAFPKDPH